MNDISNAKITITMFLQISKFDAKIAIITIFQIIKIQHIYNIFTTNCNFNNDSNQIILSFQEISMLKKNACKIFRIQINKKCESQFDKIKLIIMIACKTNIESEKNLFAFLCITTSNKSNDLQLKHVVRFIRIIQHAKRLYNEKFAKQLLLQLLI